MFPKWNFWFGPLGPTGRWQRLRLSYHSSRDRKPNWASLLWLWICLKMRFCGCIQIELARTNRKEKSSVQKHIVGLVGLLQYLAKNFQSRLPSGGKLPRKTWISKEPKRVGPTRWIKYFKFFTLRPQKPRKMILGGLLRETKKDFSIRRFVFELSWIKYQRISSL